MVIGLAIGIASQAGLFGRWIAPPIGQETVPVRWITPFDSGTEYSRRALFDEEQVRRIYQEVAPAIVSVTGGDGPY